MELSPCNLVDLASIGLALLALIIAVVDLIRSRGFKGLTWFKRG